MTEAISGIEKRFPAALLKLWIQGSAARKLEQIAPRGQGFERLDVDRWIFPLLPGEPAVFDRAARLGLRLLQALAADLGEGKVRSLIVPAVTIARSGSARLESDPLLDALDGLGGALAPDGLHLTGHAVRNLEGRWATAEGPALRLPSGRQIPTAVLGPGAPGLPPWRNPEHLGRTLRWVPIRDAARQLAELLVLPAARLTGPLGSGKTRLAWEVFRESGRAFHWRRGGADPAEASPPLERWLASDRRRPLWLVYDTLESADPGTWAELLALSRNPELGKGLHLLLIARQGAGWPPGFEAMPALEVQPLAGETWDRLAQQLFQGLNLPLSVAEGLLDACAGNPFALEEALIQLVRERQLRQVMGSFFYSGTEESSSPRPSSRFRLHFEAELLRLGAADPLRWLGLTPNPVPASELSAVTYELTGATSSPGWDEKVVRAGLARVEMGPWGEGLQHTLPLGAFALLEALDEAGQTRARRSLGELLAARSSTATEHWAAYPLVQGTAEGARVVLAALAAGGGPSPSEQERFDLLLAELAAATARGNETALESDLLAAAIPLGRKLGHLSRLAGYLVRVHSRSIETPDFFLTVSTSLAEIETRAGRYLEAERILRQALEHATSVEDHQKQQVLLELGRVLTSLGRRLEARELLEKLRGVAESTRQIPLEAECLFLLGNLAQREQRLDRAEELHLRALERRRQMPETGPLVSSLCALASLEASRGNFPACLARYEEAESLVPRAENAHESSFIFLGKGRALARLGDFESANRLLREALRVREAQGDTVGEAIACTALAEVLVSLGQLDAARSEARRALFALSLAGLAEPQADAERVLGRALHRQRRSAEALHHLVQAAEIFREYRNDSLHLEALTFRLEAALALEDATEIERAYRDLLAARQHAPSSYFSIGADYWLAVASETLARGADPGSSPAEDHLRSAYSELLRETEYLEDPLMRQKFLFQVPLHAAILEAARKAGLAAPA